MTSESHTAGAFRRVLVGFDGSKDAQHALRVAVALAEGLRGEAHVLQVIRPPAHAETAEEVDRATAAERENLSKGLSQMLLPGLGRRVITTEVAVSDDPAKALAQHAADHGFDVLVVGGHGREQITHRGIGHSLEALLRHHPCPILVV